MSDTSKIASSVNAKSTLTRKKKCLQKPVSNLVSDVSDMAAVRASASNSVSDVSNVSVAVSNFPPGFIRRARGGLGMFVKLPTSIFVGCYERAELMVLMAGYGADNGDVIIKADWLIGDYGWSLSAINNVTDSMVGVGLLDEITPAACKTADKVWLVVTPFVMGVAHA
jgi:hypothetical protein